MQNSMILETKFQRQHEMATFHNIIFMFHAFPSLDGAKFLTVIAPLLPPLTLPNVGLGQFFVSGFHDLTKPKTLSVANPCTSSVAVMAGMAASQSIWDANDGKEKYRPTPIMTQLVTYRSRNAGYGDGDDDDADDGVFGSCFLTGSLLKAGSGSSWIRSCLGCNCAMPYPTSADPKIVLKRLKRK
jgi:hypothetical protein